jgi:hypothetical protein
LDNKNIPVKTQPLLQISAQVLVSTLHSNQPTEIETNGVNRYRRILWEEDAIYIKLHGINAGAGVKDKNQKVKTT